MDKKNYSTSNETLKNENKSWDKDNQAWWDWYVSLADNSNSGKNNTFLELPEPPKIKYPAQIELKKQLSRPYNLTKHDVITFKKNGFIKLKNVFTSDAIQVLRSEILLLLKKTFKNYNKNKKNRFLSLEMMWLDNALIRENYQRNFLQSGLKDFDENDLIAISDLDEIPNFENFKYENKITFFEQKMFYYKLNLVYPNFIWFGSKICKKKHLISPQWLRNIKSKIYPYWRVDTYFSKKKYCDLGFVKNGGWHFTNIKSPELIDYKMKNFLHHLEYEESGLGVDDVKNKIKQKKVFYDHNADKRKNKWNADIKLEKIKDYLLPDFINSNKEKFKKWLD